MEVIASNLIEIYNEPSEEEFRNEIYLKRRPALLKGVNIGCCVQKWQNAQNLSETVGSAKEVKIHVSQNPKMDFLKKNFLYNFGNLLTFLRFETPLRKTTRSLPFDELIVRASKRKNGTYFISEDEFYYLRSLGDNARKEVADIRKQFPSVNNDIIFPQYYQDEQFFSSVFRVASAGVTLWTHYDIMDNILMQVVGRKKAVLFPPDDVPYLYMNGDKSEVTDIENPDLKKYPLFAKATRYECIMEPGDILFIPALWFHNMTALDFGVAVNVFWRHLECNFYDKKDPYGNKDLIAANQAMTLLEKGLKNLKTLPYDYQKFYKLRMIEMIKNKEI